MLKFERRWQIFTFPLHRSFFPHDSLNPCLYHYRSLSCLSNFWLISRDNIIPFLQNCVCAKRNSLEIIIRYIYAGEISNIILLLSFPNIVSNRDQRVQSRQNRWALRKTVFSNNWKTFEAFRKNITNLHYAPIFYSIIHNKEKYFFISSQLSSNSTPQIISYFIHFIFKILIYKKTHLYPDEIYRKFIIDPTWNYQRRSSHVSF